MTAPPLEQAASAGRGRRRRVLNIGLVLVVLVAIIGLYRLTPTQKDIQEPVAVKGVVGKAVKTPRFELLVSGVQVSKKLRIPRSAPDRDTLSDFVVVEAVAVAKREPLYLKNVSIKAADGTVYLGANRSGLREVDLTGFQLAPDIPARGSFVVEMPADQLPGSVLLVMEKQFMNDLEPRATIPLGVEKDQLDGARKDVAILNAADAR
ncbi:hypothetical protein [Kribbella sp. CA-293567]|uniref:hypothetical protein n=1 Tax=Kribbella sp. CA-293567 TaxID=3002436 RepID=UPI0022DCF7A7|nr:hypothetical protein [Kribbella sp. CA-293567]WBQ04597.1 hypothetical protein OX958_32110 [Kribbella sp. CA-293567]